MRHLRMTAGNNTKLKKLILKMRLVAQVLDHNKKRSCTVWDKKREYQYQLNVLRISLRRTCMSLNVYIFGCMQRSTNWILPYTKTMRNKINIQGKKLS